jgi:hypothetical protein
MENLGFLVLVQEAHRLYLEPTQVVRRDPVEPANERSGRIYRTSRFRNIGATEARHGSTLNAMHANKFSHPLLFDPGSRGHAEGPAALNASGVTLQVRDQVVKVLDIHGALLASTLFARLQTFLSMFEMAKSNFMDAIFTNLAFFLIPHLWTFRKLIPQIFYDIAS